MASESSPERTVSVTLPEELDKWLDDRAASEGVDRDELLVQLLASYRAASELDVAETPFGLGEEEVAETVEAEVGNVVETEVSEVLQAEVGDIVEAEVREQLADAFEEQLSGAVGDAVENYLDEQLEPRIESAVEDALSGQVSEATKSVRRQLGNRIDEVESEFGEKIQDVRERVIQVKKETDGKAPADHEHEAFAQIETLRKQVSTMESDLDQLREEFDGTVPDHDENIEELLAEVESVQDRLQTVAWVVSDLREAHETTGGLRAVERIKRAAAKNDIERANCENCGETVAISLLTDPQCPHCNATVSNVEPAGGWFGKPKLLTASQLEAGDGT